MQKQVYPHEKLGKKVAGLINDPNINYTETKNINNFLEHLQKYKNLFYKSYLNQGPFTDYITLQVGFFPDEKDFQTFPGI